MTRAERLYQDAVEDYRAIRLIDRLARKGADPDRRVRDYLWSGIQACLVLLGPARARFDWSFLECPIPDTKKQTFLDIARSTEGSTALHKVAQELLRLAATINKRREEMSDVGHQPITH